MGGRGVRLTLVLLGAALLEGISLGGRGSGGDSGSKADDGSEEHDELHGD